MDNPLISIVLPIYNVEDYLDRCLGSISEQTFTNFEVLCINDGSIDNSQAIVDRYVEKDQRFKSFIKENGGLSDARNYGLSKISAEYLMFIDSDDFVEKNVLELVYEKAIKDNLDMVVFDFNRVYIKENQVEIVTNRFEEKLVYNLKTSPELLCYINNAAWNKLYRSKLFLNNYITFPYGYRQEDLGTTPKLLYLAERIGFVNQPLYNYLADRPNNITQQYDKKIYHVIDMNIEYLEFYKTNKIFQQYYEQLKYLCVINMVNSLKKVVNFSDYQFVVGFVNDSFKFIKHYFADYPSSIYQFEKEKVDYIYTNRLILLLYIRYRRMIGKFK